MATAMRSLRLLRTRLLCTPTRLLHNALDTTRHDLTETLPHSSVLTDTFSRRHTYLRVSVTERCNLRCSYCMPEDGVALTKNDALLTTDEIDRLIGLFVSNGVDKVRFTGGEPLVRRDIETVIANANKHTRGVGGLKTIALTTNGLVLARKLPTLIDNGLSHVNISLDTLDPLKFQLISRRLGHELVIRGIRDAISALHANKLRSVKVNCVVQRTVNDDELVALAELTKDNDIEVRFIELMPFTGNQWSKNKFVSYNEMLKRINLVYPISLVPATAHETSKVYRIEGFRGRIGFISSMSDHFCASCNRLRLTADGNLKVCLFGNEEVSLKDAMRAGYTTQQLEFEQRTIEAACSVDYDRLTNPVISDVTGN